jgi:beta-glucuronidase
VVDSYTLAVGIRTVEVRGTEFLINGEPFYFTGFGRHEDIPVLGKGHDDAFMVHDFALMEWIGANSFRTSHYPYAEEVLDYADRHGFVGDRRDRRRWTQHGPGGRHLRRRGLSDVLGRHHQRRLAGRSCPGDPRACRARQNHPSVVLWSIANEPESHTEAARDYFEPLFTLTRDWTRRGRWASSTSCSRRTASAS